MGAPRLQRNRFHIDVYVPRVQAMARIVAALAAGGRSARMPGGRRRRRRRRRHLDEPQDRAQRCQVPVPGQQRRVRFQCPCQSLLV